jgi:hypothetical protein
LSFFGKIKENMYLFALYSFSSNLIDFNLINQFYKDICLPKGDSQQSAPEWKGAGQLLWPQIRFPWHSDSLSQSPSLIAQGASIEQHPLS